MRRRWWRSTLLIALALAGAVAVAPHQIGGRVSYVRTVGISMQPRLYAGDVALVRESSTYRVGDIVAYRSSEVRSVVLHRIVATAGHRFILKGDHNNFRDAERPTGDDIIGRLWIRVPAGGRVLDWVGRPLNAVAVVLVVMLVSSGFAATRRRRRRRTNQRSRVNQPSWNPTTSTTRGLAQGLALVGVAVAAVGGMAFFRPVHHQVAEAIPFSQHGRLSYDTPTPPSSLYDDGVRTGDPVFRRVVDHIDMAFHYTFDTAVSHNVNGELGITGVLRGAAGWERQLELAAPRPFKGDDARVRATVRLEDLDALAAEINDVAGLPPGELRLVVEPRVELAGSVAGHPLDERLSLPVTFLLDESRLRPEAADDGSPFSTSQNGAVTVQRPEPTRLGALGVEADVEHVRLIGLGGGAALLLGAALLWWSTNRSSTSESDRIAARYGRLLVPVKGAGGADHAVIIDVATFDALAHVARHHESLILDHERDDRHTYIVETQGIMYRYTPGTTQSHAADATVSRNEATVDPPDLDPAGSEYAPRADG